MIWICDQFGVKLISYYKITSLYKDGNQIFVKIKITDFAFENKMLEGTRAKKWAE